MQKQPEGFSAKTIDEQIEYLLHTSQSTSPGTVVQDLQGLYEQGDAPEQIHRSLDAIWSRLADHLSPENQTLYALPETDPGRVLSHIREGGVTSLPPRPAPGRVGKRKLRRTLALSTLAALVLLSVVSWTLVTHLGVLTRTGVGSGPGTVVPTIQPTPAPQSLRDQARHLLSQFHQEVTTWGQAHQYTNPFDGKLYALDYAYDQQGIGSVLDHLVAQAQSSADFQAAISQIQDEFTNLHALESNVTDKTAWNQVHSTDTSLLQHYQLQNGTVIVVSLYEQSMRVYQDGQLLKAFQVTTGRFEEPSLPGSWQILQRMENVTLKSAVPKGSPFWFPPTPVQYALLYHTGGYMLLASWWRADYGVGTNLPHRDSSGNSISNNGSGDSVDLATNAMAWLYAHVQTNTPVIIY